MLELVLARHGQSYGNLDRAWGPDTDLTDVGREQAERLAAWLVDQAYTFSAFYCSPLRRARQTADIINQHLGLEILFDRDLREAEKPYVHDMPVREDPLIGDPPPPFGPAYDALRKRVARAMERILAENAVGQVLVVSHGGTLATMLRCILGTHTLLVHTEQAAVHSLRWEDGRWHLLYLNRQEHL